MYHNFYAITSMIVLKKTRSEYLYYAVIQIIIEIPVTHLKEVRNRK